MAILNDDQSLEVILCHVRILTDEIFFDTLRKVLPAISITEQLGVAEGESSSATNSSRSRRVIGWQRKACLNLDAGDLRRES